MMSQLVILAGGLGTRLASVTQGRPKVLAEIGGKPVLLHQLELAAAYGFRDIHISAGYRAEQIEEFVKNHLPVGARIQVDRELEPLGNAGAVLDRLPLLEKDFLVLYGDVMISADLRHFADAHSRSGADFTLLVHPNDHPSDSDLVETDSQGRVTSIHLAPHRSDGSFGNLVNAGLYAIRRDALRLLRLEGKKHDFTKQVIPGLLAAGGKVWAYRSAEYLKDMGTPERLAKVQRDWERGKISPPGSGKPRPAVFLDRDGTLNVERDHLRSVADLQVLPGTASALKKLRDGGYNLVILTNQPVLARGDVSDQDLHAIHQKLEWELGKEGAFVDAIYVCPHHPDKGFAGERAELKTFCNCRKPATGLLDRACRDLVLEPADSWMVGDSTVDIEMARRAGVRSVLVKTGHGGADGKFPAIPDYCADNLEAAADYILAAKAKPGEAAPQAGQK